MFHTLCYAWFAGLKHSDGIAEVNFPILFEETKKHFKFYHMQRSFFNPACHVAWGFSFFLARTVACSLKQDLGKGFSMVFQCFRIIFPQAALENIKHFSPIKVQNFSLDFQSQVFVRKYATGNFLQSTKHEVKRKQTVHSPIKNTQENNLDVKIAQPFVCSQDVLPRLRDLVMRCPPRAKICEGTLTTDWGSPCPWTICFHSY